MVFSGGLDVQIGGYWVGMYVLFWSDHVSSYDLIKYFKGLTLSSEAGKVENIQNLTDYCACSALFSQQSEKSGQKSVKWKMVSNYASYTTYNGLIRII